VNDWIESSFVSGVREMTVEDAIVVNLSTTLQLSMAPLLCGHGLHLDGVDLHPL